MLKKIIPWLAHIIWRKGYQKAIVYFLIFFSLSLPLILICIYHTVSTDRVLRDFILEEQRASAVSVAGRLEEKLDGIANFVINFTTNPQIRQLVAKEKWTSALEYVKLFQFSTNQTSIDDVFFTDSRGNITAITPSTPEVLGKNFAFRDWYKGVVSSGQVYLSEAYQRVQKPQYNIVTMAAPIVGEDGQMIGIVGFQIRLDRFADWSKAINNGSPGFIAIVDQYGHAVSYPQFPPQGPIVDLSGLSAVKDAQKKNAGAEILFNTFDGKDEAIAYAPVSKYNWDVLVVQTTAVAFAERTVTHAVHIFMFGLLLLWGCFLIYFILKILEHFQDHFENTTR